PSSTSFTYKAETSRGVRGKQLDTRSGGNMRSSRLNVMLLSTALATIGVGLGCGQGEQGTGAGSGGGSSTGNAGFGGYPPRCVWGGGGGGLTFPVCPAMFTSEFMGTVDGMPFDTKDSGHITGVSLAISPPYQLSLGLSSGGKLDMEWGDPYIIGQWTK